VTEADLLADWAARVRRNREQVNQVREQEDGDFYAPVAESFRHKPDDSPDPTLQTVLTLLRPDDVVVDIGAGGGRFALPFAANVRRVIAVDPSPGMLGVLQQGIGVTGAENVEVVEGRWPMAGKRGTVSFIAHVGHDVDEIGPFLDAMEKAASRLCVAVMFETPPPAEVDAIWPAVHGIERASLPALPELLALLLARKRLFEVRLVDVPAPPRDAEAQLARARRLAWVREGSAKDERLKKALAAGAATRSARRVGVVSWTPA